MGSLCGSRACHHISLASPRIRFPERVVRSAARAGVRPSIEAGGVAGAGAGVGAGVVHSQPQPRTATSRWTAARRPPNSAASLARTRPRSAARASYVAFAWLASPAHVAFATRSPKTVPQGPLPKSVAAAAAQAAPHAYDALSLGMQARPGV